MYNLVGVQAQGAVSFLARGISEHYALLCFCRKFSFALILRYQGVRYAAKWFEPGHINLSLEKLLIGCSFTQP